MIKKLYELKNLYKNCNYYLFYGKNDGAKKEEIEKIILANKNKSVLKYDEKYILGNNENFLTEIYTESLFESEKIIIINYATDKIVKIIEEIKNKKKLNIFIQINVGNEDQKNGISVDALDDFYKKCTDELGLKIVGLMCLPPNNKDSSIYFSLMQKLVKKFSLKESSMGMSNDYLDAINFKATYLRIGSKIFGLRN